jgi:hypothetical protein
MMHLDYLLFHFSSVFKKKSRLKRDVLNGFFCSKRGLY